MESIEQKLHRIEERIHSLELQGLVTSSPYLTESDFPSAGLDQIVVHNGTNQVIGYFPATSDGLDSAIGSAGSGDAIWLPACIVGDDHSVPAGVSLIGVGRYVSILTGQITLASGAALVSLSILRTGSSSATAVVVSSGSAYINSCKLSVVLTAGTAYLVSPYGNAYLSSCELVCTVNGVNVTPFEGLRNLTFTFDSTLQGWVFDATQVAYTTGAVGMTVNDASVLAWSGGKLRFTVPSFNTNWKYGSAVIDVSSRNFVITQDSVLSFTVSESYTGNSFYGALIEFTDGTSQAFSNMWTGGTIDDTHIGKTIKKIYVGYLIVNMYNPRTIDFDNIVVTNVGGSAYVHACSGISAPGTYTDGDRAVYDALTAPSQHANDIDVAAGLHHTIGTTTGKAADGGVVNSHINNTSNPHSVTKAQVGLGNVANVLHKLDATTAPTAGDDAGDGYSIGSKWVDTSAKKVYECVDASVGSASWLEMATGSGSSSGDVSGPASATDGDIAVFSGTSGKIIKVGPTFPGVGPTGIKGCKLWLDAGYISGLSDGGTIEIWPDRSGFGHDAIAYGSPVYKTNILNSLPVVRLDGSSYFKLFNFPLIAPSFSWILVFKMSSLSNSYTGVVTYSITSDGGGYFLKSNGKSAEFWSSSYDGSGAASFDTSNWNYIISNHKAATFNTRRNGSADVSGTGSAARDFPETACLGNHLSYAGRVMSGDIAEMIVFDKFLTSSEITAIENYVKAKYGLS